MALAARSSAGVGWIGHRDCPTGAFGLALNASGSTSIIRGEPMGSAASGLGAPRRHVCRPTKRLHCGIDRAQSRHRHRCETAQVHPPQPGRTDHSVWLSLPSTLAKL